MPATVESGRTGTPRATGTSCSLRIGLWVLWQIPIFRMAPRFGSTPMVAAGYSDAAVEQYIYQKASASQAVYQISGTTLSNQLKLVSYNGWVWVSDGCE